MPLVEVSMVIQNMISPMLESLKTHALDNEMQIPEKIMNQWPIEKSIHEEVKSSLAIDKLLSCLLYTSPSPRDRTRSRMPSSA